MSLHKYIEQFPKIDGVAYVAFNAGHVAAMHIQSQNFQHLSKAMPLMDMLEHQAKLGHAITVMLHDRPVGCFGAVKLWHGVEEMWVLMEERARNYPKTMTKLGRIYRDIRWISEGLHRLQICVRCEDERAVRWGQAIGFDIEGRMKSYGPDKSDCFLMSRS